MIEVILARKFAKALRRLAKKYPNVAKDVELLRQQLLAGQTPGDRLQHARSYTVYKVRVPNRDAKRGKSGGYRVIYYLQTLTTIYFVTMYSKSDQEDISIDLILQIIEEIGIDTADDNDPPSA